MAKAAQLGVYKCNVCGNIVELIHLGGGELVCCGQPMELLIEKIADQGKEKHYIEWIEILADGAAYRKFLKPGDKPEAEFCIGAQKIEAREFCNVHGLWKA